MILLKLIIWKNEAFELSFDRNSELSGWHKICKMGDCLELCCGIKANGKRFCYRDFFHTVILSTLKSRNQKNEGAIKALSQIQALNLAFEQNTR